MTPRNRWYDWVIGGVLGCLALGAISAAISYFIGLISWLAKNEMAGLGIFIFATLGACIAECTYRFRQWWRKG